MNKKNGNQQKVIYKAYEWTLLGTTVPILISYVIAKQVPKLAGLAVLLFLGGTLVGPSSGQMYLDSPEAALGGIGLRTLGAGLFLFGAATVGITPIVCDEAGEACSNNSNGNLLIPIGALTYAGGFLYSIIDTGIKSTRRKKHAQNTLSIFPMLTPEQDGTIKSGLLACLRF